jgi:hypothetical protein
MKNIVYTAIILVVLAACGRAPIQTQVNPAHVRHADTTNGTYFYNNRSLK